MSGTSSGSWPITSGTITNRERTCPWTATRLCRARLNHCHQTRSSRFRRWVVCIIDTRVRPELSVRWLDVEALAVSASRKTLADSGPCSSRLHSSKVPPLRSIMWAALSILRRMRFSLATGGGSRHLFRCLGSFHVDRPPCLRRHRAVPSWRGPVANSIMCMYDSCQGCCRGVPCERKCPQSTCGSESAIC